MVNSFSLIRLYYTKFLKRFQGNHDIVIQIYYNFGQISAAAVSGKFSRRRLIDFLPRLLYNKTVQGAAPAAGKHAPTAALLYMTPCFFAYRFRSWAAASAAPACSEQIKNTARTRQAVQFVGRGDAIRTRNLRFWRPLLYR